MVETGAGDYGLTEDLHLALNHAMVRVFRGGRPHRYGCADADRPGKEGQ